MRCTAFLPILAVVLLSGCQNRDRLTDEQASAPAAAATNEQIVPPSGEGADVAAMPPDPGPVIYKALGTEPGWALTIRQGAMLFQGDYGNVRLVEATPPGFKAANGQVRSGRLTVRIAAGPCSDGMSDHVWRDKVTVTVAGGGTSTGCGGGLMAVADPNEVGDGEYAVTAINGRPTGAGSRFRLRIAGDQISGVFGCNSFSGRSSRNGDHFSVGQMAATQMACAGPAGEFERDGFAVLGSNMRIEKVNGQVRLVSEAGSIDFVPLAKEIPSA